MTEREPIDELADELFAAARRERPEDRVRARAKQLAVSARTGINAVEARGPAATYAPMIAVAVAIALLAFVAAGALHTRKAREPIAVTPEIVERDIVAQPREPVRHQTPAARRTEDRAEVVQDERLPAEKPAQPQSKSTPRPQPPLADEIALLDQARSALTANESARVIALIDQYERVLGGTRMRAEAALLRIEALAQGGQRARAAQLAQRFVEEHAGNPLAERARTLAKIEEPSEDPR
jgi:hypothetical protein